MIEKQFYVYILASKPMGVLYIGMTSDLIKRLYEHKSDAVDGFTKRYFVKMLVYFEMHETAESAITREKQLKRWKRNWKIELIEKHNPIWTDMYDQIAA